MCFICFYSMSFHMDFNTGLFRRQTKSWFTHQLNYGESLQVVLNEGENHCAHEYELDIDSN